MKLLFLMRGSLSWPIWPYKASPPRQGGTTAARKGGHVNKVLLFGERTENGLKMSIREILLYMTVFHNISCRYESRAI